MIRSRFRLDRDSSAEMATAFDGTRHLLHATFGRDLWLLGDTTTHFNP